MASPGDSRSSAAHGPGKKMRADMALVERGLAPSREKARALILAGEVLGGDRPLAKAGDLVSPDAELRLRSQPLPFVSRGGLKLAKALEAFEIAVGGRVALDVGASTGGFTDCLLQHGAVRVYCIDVGHGQLHEKIARDPRVVAHDRTNIRHVASGFLPEMPSLVAIDVSFIALRLVLPAVQALAAPDADVIALVKPQFEVGRTKVGKGGIVRDESARLEALEGVAQAATSLGFSLRGHITSPITGAKGNVEFLLHLRTPALRS